MASFIYKEEVVRWIRVEIPPQDSDMDACDLEYHHRAKAIEQANYEGWDGEDVLECHYLKDRSE